MYRKGSYFSIFAKRIFKNILLQKLKNKISPHTFSMPAMLSSLVIQYIIFNSTNGIFYYQNYLIKYINCKFLKNGKSISLMHFNSKVYESNSKYYSNWRLFDWWKKLLMWESLNYWTFWVKELWSFCNVTPWFPIFS